MKTIQLPDVLSDERTRREVVVSVLEGRVFLYPTDTIYGLGCDASNPSAVRRIRAIKTTIHPFSVIPPSKEWIRENLRVTQPEYLRRLPGPYTLIFRMKERVVCEQVSVRTLGVRIPRHPFTRVVQESGTPFVTTSANISGEVPVWSTQGVPSGIERSVEIAVHDDILNNPPSRVIDLTGKRPRILR
jgi:tRNA threonylcarbamoyl adenosine modification protein (Sua5/YciO/YrdC/YwlC family)